MISPLWRGFKDRAEFMQAAGTPLTVPETHTQSLVYEFILVEKDNEKAIR